MGTNILPPASRPGSGDRRLCTDNAVIRPVAAIVSSATRTQGRKGLLELTAPFYCCWKTQTIISSFQDCGN